MFYETISRRTEVDKKGNDKSVTERFLVDGCDVCSEAELKTLEFWNSENEVIAIKQSSLREMINERKDDEQDIYLSQIEDIFVDENSGEEKATKYVVGLFAKSLEEATRETLKYMQMGIIDMNLVKVQRTKIVEVLK